MLTSVSALCGLGLVEVVYQRAMELLVKRNGKGRPELPEMVSLLRLGAVGEDEVGESGKVVGGGGQV